MGVHQASTSGRLYGCCLMICAFDSLQSVSGIPTAVGDDVLFGSGLETIGEDLDYDLIDQTVEMLFGNGDGVAGTCWRNCRRCRTGLHW